MESRERKRRGFMKISVHNLQVSPFFAGDVRYFGNAWVELSGTFGKKAARDETSDWSDKTNRTSETAKTKGTASTVERNNADISQLLCWNLCPYKEKDMPVIIFPELWTDGSVESFLEVSVLSKGTKGAPYWFHQYPLRNEMAPIVLSEPIEGQLSFSLFARGKGTLHVGTLHVREQRSTYGTILPGDRRIADSFGGELFSYFDPGDRKPPLTVHFADIDRQEAFGDTKVFRLYGVPQLQFFDPRLFDGCFYIGTEDLEKRITETITHAMQQLHFDGKDVVFSGFGMGAYAALYYGMQFKPVAILMTEPVLDIYTAAKGERTLRPGRFPGAMDAYRYLMLEKGLRDPNVLNDLIWQRTDAADFSQTEFAIAYMQDDDFDPEAYDKLVSHLSKQGVRIYGKGITGRHGDAPDEIRSWYLHQYRRILAERFERQ